MVIKATIEEITISPIMSKIFEHSLKIILGKFLIDSMAVWIQAEEFNLTRRLLSQRINKLLRQKWEKSIWRLFGCLQRIRPPHSLRPLSQTSGKGSAKNIHCFDHELVK